MGFIDTFKPALVCLSEPQIFQCDIISMFTAFQGKYSFHLNSEDLLCPDLPLDTRRAVGGTMAMWASQLDPYIRVLPTSTSSILPLLLSIPGISPSIHLTIYLPTHGRDSEFAEALATLDSCVSDFIENFSGPIYLRGDFNVNPQNTSRVNLLNFFCTKFSFSSLDFGHPSHHHFTDGGLADSQLDLLLYRGPPAPAESLTSLTCSLTDTSVNSHHDLIISTFPLARQPILAPQATISAPKIENSRVKIRWSDGALGAYESLVSPCLARLRETWGEATGPASFSILLSSTYDTLNLAAQQTQRFANLSKPHQTRPYLPPEVREAQAASLAARRHLRTVRAAPQPAPALVAAARCRLTSTRAELRRAQRRWQQGESAKRDERLATGPEYTTTSSTTGP